MINVQKEKPGSGEWVEIRQKYGCNYTYVYHKTKHSSRIKREDAEHLVFRLVVNMHLNLNAARLGLEKGGGMVRVGPVHYNTVEEVQRFGEVLRKIVER